MTLTVLAWLSFLGAAVPAYVFLRNYTIFRPLPAATTANDHGKRDSLPSVSVLIPARNEAHSIAACVDSVLANHDVDFEVLVLDDHSEDATPTIVKDLMTRDTRVRLEQARPLPSGWCGKQHACAQLGELAKNDVFVFLDADVRLASDALPRILERWQQRPVHLLSGFPLQRTGTLAECMLIPLIHFVLLGFLSLRRMRSSTHPAYGAGCGQLFITSREAYRTTGGHAAIRASLHDGIKLPRMYRAADQITDLFDATDLATCRMYHSASEVWYGLKKNATEGAASKSLIVPVTLLLFAGQVLPFCLLASALLSMQSGMDLDRTTFGLIIAAVSLAWLPRFLAAKTFRQSWLGALLHPISIVLFLCIQWSAFAGSFSKRPVSWKGRPYPAA